MVYAFIINTILPGIPRLLYYDIFGQDGVADDSLDITADVLTSIRKSQIQQVFERVHSEYQFRRSFSGRSVEDDVLKLINDDTLPEFDTGFFRLRAGEVFQKDRYVIWLAAGYTAFSFVCEKYENRLVAESILKHLIRYLQEHVRVLTQPSETGLRSERVGVVVNTFLPQGNLLFLNNRLIRQLEKEVDNQIKAS
ncbi:hypothetical protein LOTGIDRAFT_196130 [Lottia gigantea]|uniref:AP complex mu/sigma subunit domain-containing protein n=1 Tax=Lottia gigantea TaxID=225164 RepID=V3ZLF7_LOTGI|nr:hypothetical protein LOTGIDRAFT_196130 [Lottia gigantea]ESO85132.1 hypothetical protein LOTGIDRAFT_196130 [Lottia gigantea]